MKSDTAFSITGGYSEDDAAQVKQIRNECLRLLARRDHSRKEIQDKLAIKGYARSDVSAIVDNLAQQSWQDDKRYAESYARARSQKGYGPVRITYELGQRGLDAETIENIVQPMSENWLDNLRHAYNKKYASPEIVGNIERSKRIRFLLQRGFSIAMINTLFE